MKKYVVIALSAMILSFAAKAQPAADGFAPYYKYRVYLHDKKNAESKLRHPERFLSEKAIERRRRQNLPIDATDVPISAEYLKRISKTGVRVVSKSKWNNTVVVSCGDTTEMDGVRRLPFVRKAVQVARYAEREKLTAAREDYKDPERTRDSLWYGTNDYSMTVIDGKGLHEAGYSGDGMTIAVIDGGFRNADRIDIMKNTKIAGTRNFIGDSTCVYASHDDHGLQVLSCMGAAEPYVMVGAAPEASYWLLASEDAGSEQEVEEDNWAAALEFADSVGADVVNSSLGYEKYGEPRGEVMYYDRNGRTQLISRTASMAAGKGMIVCCAAGNAGEDIMSTIGVPADAPDIITVGSVGCLDGQPQDVLFFSSRGGTYDGRIKPDVLSQGWLNVVKGDGKIGFSYGTSLSAPTISGMMACLWQALPSLTAYEIMEIVRLSGDRASSPDNTYGYGVPDFKKAWDMGRTLATEKSSGKSSGK